MIPHPSGADLFKKQLRESVRHEAVNARTVRIARHADVYCCGDQDDRVYFIEEGQIKLRVASWEGKECLLASAIAGRAMSLFTPVQL